ncbi:hypothetical protein M885DRAFT_559726 [Pelagophyceae sp. CCMP2097]|nr:hypothetical protein M885DRAFT_559726 [Pelagophyceae sp. CCMP2097]
MFLLTLRCAVGGLALRTARQAVPRQTAAGDGAGDGGGAFSIETTAYDPTADTTAYDATSDSPLPQDVLESLPAELRGFDFEGYTFDGGDDEGGMDMDDLAKLEAELLAGGRPAPLGRETAGYRWSQDAAHVELYVPLRDAPPDSDVSLVVTETSFKLDLHGAKHHGFDGVSGALGGAVVPERSAWAVSSGAEGAGIVVRLYKRRQAGEGACDMWRHALQGEASAPTAQLSGLCAITEARFLQFADSVEIEVDVPAATKARDVRLELSAETWDLELAGHLAFEQLGGSFCGAIRPDRTAWPANYF